MKEFLEENKNKLIVVGVIFALVIAFTIVNNLFNKKDVYVNPEESIKEMASVYYQELYYPYLKENYKEYYESLLTDYGNKGLKIGLDKIIESIRNVDTKALTGKNNKNVDISSTYVIFYPQSPYTEEDYRVELDVNYFGEFASEGGGENE